MLKKEKEADAYKMKSRASARDSKQGPKSLPFSKKKGNTPELVAEPLNLFYVN